MVINTPKLVLIHAALRNADSSMGILVETENHHYTSSSFNTLVALGNK